MNKITLDEAKRKYPNNYDLGEFIRHNLYEIRDLNMLKLQAILKKYPNDYSLGNYIRQYSYELTLFDNIV